MKGIRMIRRVFVSLVVVTAIIASTTGCAPFEERFTPEPTIVTEEATRAIAGATVEGKLSKNTPADIPLWPSASVIESSMTEDAYSLTLQTTDVYIDVLTGVAVGFEDAGWQVAKDEFGEKGAGSAILSVTRGGDEGIITITELEGGLVEIDYVIASAV
jgi:hypothetical protein